MKPRGADGPNSVQDDIITSLDMRLDKLYRVIHCERAV